MADSGASWDLAKKVNMIVFDKGDAILKDVSHKYMDVVQSKQGWQQLKEKPPDSQAISSGEDQWRKSSRASRAGSI